MPAIATCSLISTQDDRVHLVVGDCQPTVRLLNCGCALIYKDTKGRSRGRFNATSQIPPGGKPSVRTASYWVDTSSSRDFLNVTYPRQLIQCRAITQETTNQYFLVHIRGDSFSCLYHNQPCEVIWRAGHNIHALLHWSTMARQTK